MKRLVVPCLLALLASPVGAGVRPLELADLCRNSTRIVRGVITGSEVRWEGNGIVTRWLLNPTLDLKGTGTETIRIRVPGERIGALTMHASEAPRFRKGEDVVVFLRPGNGKCDVYGWFRGKYTVVGGLVREKQGTPIARFLKDVRGELELAKKGR